MVNSATGVAESPSILTTCASGAGNCRPLAASSAPSAIAHGSGLVIALRSERTADAANPGAASGDASDSSGERAWCCATARHSVLVKIRSISTVPMIGPAARSPSIATSSGTPMKPVFGNAATSAPKAASRSPTPGPLSSRRSVAAMVKNTISSALARYTPISAGSISCANGMLDPKRNSRHGNAKNSTKPLSPGIADSGMKRRWAAR